MRLRKTSVTPLDVPQDGTPTLWILQCFLFISICIFDPRSDAPAPPLNVQGFVSLFTVGLSSAARSDNLATTDRDGQIHTAKTQQHSGATKTKASPNGRQRGAICSRFKDFTLSEEFYSRSTLHIRRQCRAASISSPHSDSKAISCSQTYRKNTLPPRSLASFVHTGISGIPLEVRLFLIAASSRHSQPHATMQMTRKTSRGTRMHVFIFISSSTCVRRNLYSVANVICIILYSAPITAN